MTETIDGARWSREELEGAYQNWYRTISAAARGEVSWKEYVALYTDDVVYHEQIQGDLVGRDAVWAWASSALETFPGDRFRFPEIWHAIDETQGLIIAQIKNEMIDPGDGVVSWEPHISVLTYAGDGRFSTRSSAAGTPWSTPRPCPRASPRNTVPARREGRSPMRIGDRPSSVRVSASSG